MKLDIKKGVGFESNMETESHRFSIGKNEDLFIDMFRNRLYSDKIKTPIQEYLSNAKDANVAAGRADVPLKITLPTELEPNLRIRDFGNGVPPEKIGLFVTYGESDKRESNDFIGGFGIGSKSAWAYTDSFQVITYIDGVKRGYVSHIGRSQAGDLDKLSESKTEEPNGTEIVIPVQIKDVRAFRKAVFYTTFFWEIKPILLGILPEEIPDSYREIDKLLDYEDGYVLKNQDDFFCYYDGRSYDKRLILNIDGIPYFYDPSEEMHKNLKMFKKILVLNFKNGELQIAVSRESVDKMPENEEKILDKIKKVNEEVLRKVKKDVESCKTLQDHYKVRREFFNYYNNRETTHMDPKTGITLKKDLLDGLFTKKYEIQDFPFTIDETGKAKNDHYLAFFEFKRYYTKRYGKKVFNQLVVDTREVDYTEQNEDGVVETKQRTEVLEKELDLTRSTLYLFLDQEEKPRNLSRKIKQLLLTGIQNPDGVVVKPREVVLVQPKMDHEFSFKDEIFWKNSSTVILPKPVKREKDDRIVVFSVGSKAYGGYKLVSEKYDQEELSDYHDDGKKFVYFPVKGKGIGIDDVDFYHIKGLERYYSKRDCKLIGLSSASVKKWPEDVPLKELDLEELKEKGLKEEEKAAKILDNSMVDFIDSFVVHYFKDEDIARIKDKRMKFAISCKKTMNKVAQESDLGSALELFTEESKKIDDRKNKYKEFFLKLKKDYKCLKYINYNYTRGISFHEKEAREEARQELVEVVINLINSNWSGK